jgi:pSer/pThr/pTyr-binding forkhead associated (FHA) protein
VDRLTRRYQRQTEVKAYLIVLAGDMSEGKHLEIYGTTTIGRSNEDADLAFQQHTENSPISRRQCTILDEEDHFKIRDEDSANGTYLNGVRLPPMEPRELYDGDEIELARVERGGVRLQFQSTQTVYESSLPAATDFDDYSPRETRRVRKQQSPGQRPGDRF